MTPPSLEGTDVARSFGGLRVLHRVSFSVPEGEIVALIGPNGAGKTTPFNLVSGLLRPSAGSIRVGDREIGALPAHRIARLGLGRTFQTPRPFLDLTAADDVAAAARWAERPGVTPRELLALVEMSEQPRGPPRSSGTSVTRGKSGAGASLARSRARRYSRPRKVAMAPTVQQSLRAQRWWRSLATTTAVTTVLVLAWTLPAAAQTPPKTARIGMLLYSNPEADPTVATLRQGLRGLGYREGQNLIIDYRAAEGRPERLPALAGELVGSKPDLLVAIGGDVTPAAQRATSSIPIVAWVSNDPVQAGFAASIPRPGRNITGVTLILDSLAGKRLALVKEVAPRITRVGIVWNPEHADPEFRECQRAAQALGMTLQSLEVHQAADFDAALQLAIRERSETLVAVSSRLVTLHRKRLIDFAAQKRIPLVGDWGPWAENGALLAYGPSATEMTERMVSYVDRVLKGARPGDLPFLQPTRFELTVNTGVARSLGLIIPESVLVRADRVIQ